MVQYPFHFLTYTVKKVQAVIFHLWGGCNSVIRTVIFKIGCYYALHERCYIQTCFMNSLVTTSSKTWTKHFHMARSEALIGALDRSSYPVYWILQFSRGGVRCRFTIETNNEKHVRPQSEKWPRLLSSGHTVLFGRSSLREKWLPTKFASDGTFWRKWNIHVVII